MTCKEWIAYKHPDSDSSTPASVKYMLGMNRCLSWDYFPDHDPSTTVVVNEVIPIYNWNGQNIGTGSKYGIVNYPGKGLTLIFLTPSAGSYSFAESNGRGYYAP